MKIKELKEWMKGNLIGNLGRNYDYLVDYFEALKDDSADYIILISRRCFILYQMIAFVLDWKRKNVISDNGLLCNRVGLGKAEKVIVGDDLMFSGNTIDHILDKMKIYLRSNCEKKATVFCRCNNYRSNLQKYPVKAYSVRTERDCMDLSNLLLKSIRSNGMPYAVFTYSYYGVEKKQRIDFFKNIKHKECCSVFNEGEKNWDSKVYFGFSDKIKILKDTICDEVCLRVYREKKENLNCIIPFAFLKNVPYEFIEKYFTQILQCFKNVGSNLFYNELKAVLELPLIDSIYPKEMMKEKFVYLTSILACCLSRVSGILFDVEDIYNEREESIRNRILGGNFSETVVNEINNMDKKYVITLLDELNKHREILRECVQDDRDGTGDDFPDHYRVEIGDKKCEEVLADIFEIMREHFNNDNDNDSSYKYINCDGLIKYLFENFPKEEIYSAEIKMWDEGIANYNFSVDETRGIKSQCRIGERSQLIFSYKYYAVLKRFFENLPYYSKEYTQMQVDIDIEKILEEIDEINLTDKEKKEFSRIANKGILNLYNRFIKI